MIIGGIEVLSTDLKNMALVKPYFVARSMGRIVRFGGATEEPVSDLNHSLAGAFYALAKWNDGGEAAMGFLLHDAAEVFCGEVPYSFKTDAQKSLEAQVHAEMLKGWGLHQPEPDTQKAIRWLDNAIAQDEAHEYGIPGYPLPDSGDMLLRRIVRDVKVKYPFGDHKDLWALFHQIVVEKNINLLDLAFKG